MQHKIRAVQRSVPPPLFLQMQPESGDSAPGLRAVDNPRGSGSNQTLSFSSIMGPREAVSLCGAGVTDIHYWGACPSLFDVSDDASL
jgi:hypothetical protein